MPQEFYVLKCFSCETFQVHIVKKAKKWECKICGTKQSLKRNYGKGSSKDCRNHVMKLNELRITKSNDLNELEGEIFDETWTDNLIEGPIKEESREQKPSVSKWAEYMEENIPDAESETEDNASILMEFADRKKKRVKKMPKFRNKKICKESYRSELHSENYEEAVELSLASTNEKIFSLDETEQTDFIEPKNDLKSGKYAKYLQDDEDKNDLPQKVNKTSSIFESNLTDLDDVLNL